jgi:hypothetical protein
LISRRPSFRYQRHGGAVRQRIADRAQMRQMPDHVADAGQRLRDRDPGSRREVRQHSAHRNQIAPRSS